MKIALVTGGSRGIGRAVCYELASSGYHVIINYLGNEEAAKETLNHIVEDGGSAELLRFDVSSQKEVQEAIEKWKQANPEKNIHTLINNAGIRKDNLLVFMEENDWNSVLGTGLNSFFYLAKALIQDMIIAKSGRIVNVVSLSGIKGMPGQTNYSAAKGGVIAATKALAQEVARKKITVNAVAPGFIKTDMTEDLNEKDFKRLIPMNRFGKPEEVASAVAFLASEKASYITGEVISINGGLYT